MEMTTEQIEKSLLAQLAEARSALTAAEEHYRNVLGVALSEGIAQAKIARTIGVSRQAVHQMG
jgi:DNA-binding XRE family transcriptional regulator